MKLIMSPSWIRSEEPLLSSFRSRFVRGFMVESCALLALLIGYYALLVLGAAFSGNGSVFGGALLFAFANSLPHPFCPGGTEVDFALF